MVGRVTVLGTALIVGVVLAIGAAGWLRPVDDALRDLRAEVDHRPPTGDVVFLDIDAQTLEMVGVWPWPREIHADIIDRLMDLGANEVALDIDFSTTSDEAGDAALEAALERAGGYVMLAAFRQPDSGDDAPFNLPLKRFQHFASPVIVNVGIDGRGVVRSYPFGVMLGEAFYPSLAMVFAGIPGVWQGNFLIDYSIETEAIDRISVRDLLSGVVEQSRIEGKQVVVGASALELRDTFTVPTGTLPGALVQILATETLKQARVLAPAGPVPGMVLVLVLALLSLTLRERVTLRYIVVGALGFSLLLEIVAFVLQARAGIVLDTALVQVAQFGLVLRTVALEIGIERFHHLKASHERDTMRSILDRVIADNFDGVVVIEEGGGIVAASQLAADVLGEGLIGKNATEVLPRQIEREVRKVLAGGGTESRVAPAELLLPGPEQEGRIIEYSITVSQVTETRRHSGEPTRRIACLTFRDITERRHKDRRLTYLVSHDAMTGAWSRFKLVELIDTLMADDRSRAKGVTVILIDLGRFKAINDTLGHGFGDMVLKQVAGRLKAADIEAVARLGGDTFALCRRGVMETVELEAFCTAVLDRVTDTYFLEEGHQAIIAASAGATTSAASGYDPQVLLSHADMALSVAKRIPGNNFALFVPEMDERLKSKQDMELALRRAIERNELSLTYQPQIELETGRLVGVEALVRWNHPELGSVSPAQFVPASEETGQIVELGRFVLQTACREAATWPNTVRLAVNVSPIQFELCDVVEEVKEALALSGLDPKRLDLEITEGLFMSQAASITETLQRLRSLGLGIALDDFGTGYSSLSYLGRLPVDKIKIDQSFVRSLPGNQESGAIIRAVMTLSETLNKVVIAEGVENADQAWMLRILGCRIGQGYHFGRPKTAGEMALLVAGEERAGNDGEAARSQS